MCKYFGIFYYNFIGKSAHKKPGKLVTKPFNKRKNAIENFNMTEYKYFIFVYFNQQLGICQKIHCARANQIAENRIKLISVIQTIILCGRKYSDLRGTFDAGTLVLKITQ